MTVEWHGIESEEIGPAEAVVVIAGQSLPLVSATPSSVVVRGPLADGVVFPAATRVVIAHADESFAFQLVATERLPGGDPDLVTFAVEAQNPLVWAVAAGDFAAGMEPTLEIVTAAARTGFAGEEDPKRERPPFSLLGFARIHARKMGLVALVLILALVVSRQLYARVYVAGANASVISIDLVPVQSPSSGRIVFLTEKPRLVEGEPLIGITQRSGSDVSLESPCSCDVFARLAVPGGIVTRGDPVLYLARPDAEPFVVANIDRALLFRFGRGAHVRLSYGDGVVVERELDAVRLIETPDLTVGEDDPANAASPATAKTDETTSTVNLRLQPGRALDRSMIGSPVGVTFDLFDNSPIAHLISATGLWKGRAADASG